MTLRRFGWWNWSSLIGWTGIFEIYQMVVPLNDSQRKETNASTHCHQHTSRRCRWQNTHANLRHFCGCQSRPMSWNRHESQLPQLAGGFKEPSLFIDDLHVQLTSATWAIHGIQLLQQQMYLPCLNSSFDLGNGNDWIRLQQRHPLMCQPTNSKTWNYLPAWTTWGKWRPKGFDEGNDY